MSNLIKDSVEGVKVGAESEPVDFSGSPVVALIDASGGASDAQVIAMVEFAYLFAGKAGGVMLFHDTVIKGEPMTIDAETVAGLVAGRVHISGRGGSEIRRPVEQAIEVAAKDTPKRLLVLSDFVLPHGEVDDAVVLAMAASVRGVEATFVGCCDAFNADESDSDATIQRIKSMGCKALDLGETRAFAARMEADQIMEGVAEVAKNPSVAKRIKSI